MRGEDEELASIAENLTRAQIERMSEVSFSDLVALVESTRNLVTRLRDGRELVTQTEFVWNDEVGGSIRVIVDTRVMDGPHFQGDDFIKAPDGSFVWE